MVVERWHPEQRPACALDADPRYASEWPQMAWPSSVCNCIGCVYREISQVVWAGLFSAWGEWPSYALFNRRAEDL